MVKILPAMQETQFQPLGWEDPLEEETAIHSRILGWEISQTEEPGPEFLPGKSHRQRSLVGYSPLCCNELDTT